MSIQEIDTLEELFRSGLVLELEYKQRKQALAEEGIISSNDSKARQEGGDTIELVELNNLPIFMEYVQSNDPTQCYQALQKIRKLSAAAVHPPLKELVAAGIVPFLVRFLQENNYPDIQYEAAWCLVNITSGPSDLVRIVADSGAVPELMSLMFTSSNTRMIEQCIWALGNIAGDGVRARDMLLAQGLMTNVIAVASAYQTIPSILKISVWVVSNLCRGKPSPNFQQVQPALPMLAFLLHSSEDPEVLGDTLWSLTFISDGPCPSSIQALLDLNLLPRVVQLVSSVHTQICVPALRTIGNIASGNDSQTQELIQLNVVPLLASLLASPKVGIRKEACWTISNIGAGNKEQIQSLCDANIFPEIIQIASANQQPPEVRKEALWVLANTTSGAIVTQIEYLMRCGVTVPLINATKTPKIDASLLDMILDSFDRILKIGKRNNKLAEYERVIKDEGGFAQLEMIGISHSQEEVRDKALNILACFFVNNIKL